MAKRYLITGGAGFIGSHLAERLVADGHFVTALDDLSTGRLENVGALQHSDRFRLIRDTVENSQTIDIAVSQADEVFHLAAAVGVQLILDQPVRTIRTTIHGTEVVLDAASRFNRPVLITSSSEVYGKGARVPFDEDDDVVMGPTKTTRYCYAYCKGIDEFLGLSYHKQFGLPVTIVRLFNTVGPRQVGMYGMVMPRFVEAALKAEPLMVNGDGQQTRCFIHVSDVVDALIRLMADRRHAGRVYNLGGSEEVSINDLARRVIVATKSNSPTQHISYEEAYGHDFQDMTRRVPKLDRIQTAIGFRPKLSLDQIIESIVADASQKSVGGR